MICCSCCYTLSLALCVWWFAAVLSRPHYITFIFLLSKTKTVHKQINEILTPPLCLLHLFPSALITSSRLLLAPHAVTCFAPIGWKETWGWNKYWLFSATNGEEERKGKMTTRGHLSQTDGFEKEGKEITEYRFTHVPLRLEITHYLWINLLQKLFLNDSTLYVYVLDANLTFLKMMELF